MGNVQLGAGEISPSQALHAAPSAGSAAMEGGGAYNRHAHMQAAAGGIALPFLLEAAAAVDIADGDAAICIADYGASQGRNSLAPMRAVIAALRTRIGGTRPITVIHTDLPSNDARAGSRPTGQCREQSMPPQTSGSRTPLKRLSKRAAPRSAA